MPGQQMMPPRTAASLSRKQEAHGALLATRDVQGPAVSNRKSASRLSQLCLPEPSTRLFCWQSGARALFMLCTALFGFSCGWATCPMSHHGSILPGQTLQCPPYIVAEVPPLPWCKASPWEGEWDPKGHFRPISICPCTGAGSPFPESQRRGSSRTLNQLLSTRKKLRC